MSGPTQGANLTGFTGDPLHRLLLPDGRLAVSLRLPELQKIMAKLGVKFTPEMTKSAVLDKYVEFRAKEASNGISV